MRLLPTMVALACASSSFAADDAAWEKIHDRDGMVVYQRDLAGVSTISLRGEATIDATVTDVVDVMKNNAEAHQWMPLVAAKRALRTMSPTERIELTCIHMPWPLADRYFVNRGRAEFLSDGVVRLSIESVDEPLIDRDEVKGMVLGVLHVSEFTLTPIDGGKRTRLALEVNSDPRGLIPKWIVNVAQRTWPLDFFQGLTRQLAKHGKLAH